MWLFLSSVHQSVCPCCSFHLIQGPTLPPQPASQKGLEYPNHVKLGFRGWLSVSHIRSHPRHPTHPLPGEPLGPHHVGPRLLEVFVCLWWAACSPHLPAVSWPGSLGMGPSGHSCLSPVLVCSVCLRPSADPVQYISSPAWSLFLRKPYSWTEVAVGEGQA